MNIFHVGQGVSFSLWTLSHANKNSQTRTHTTHTHICTHAHAGRQAGSRQAGRQAGRQAQKYLLAFVPVHWVDHDILTNALTQTHSHKDTRHRDKDIYTERLGERDTLTDTLIHRPVAVASAG